MIGVTKSDCKIPCLQTYVNVQEAPSQITTFNHNRMYITFDDMITREVTTVDKFSLIEALNYLGSNLGLWPGLGLFQLLELSMLIFTSCNANLRKKNLKCNNEILHA